MKALIVIFLSSIIFSGCMSDPVISNPDVRVTRTDLDTRSVPPQPNRVPTTDHRKKCEPKVTRTTDPLYTTKN